MDSMALHWLTVCAVGLLVAATGWFLQIRRQGLVFWSRRVGRWVVGQRPGEEWYWAACRSGIAVSALILGVQILAVLATVIMGRFIHPVAPPEYGWGSRYTWLSDLACLAWLTCHGALVFRMWFLRGANTSRPRGREALFGLSAWLPASIVLIKATHIAGTDTFVSSSAFVSALVAQGYRALGFGPNYLARLAGELAVSHLLVLVLVVTVTSVAGAVRRPDDTVS